jgi:hypothetical protein
LRSHYLVDWLATALPEGGVHFPDGVGVEGMTRAVGIPAEVSRHPLGELSVWLSLDDLIGHSCTACFVGTGAYRILELLHAHHER